MTRSMIDVPEGHTLVTMLRGDVRAAHEYLIQSGVRPGLVCSSPPFLALRSYLPEGHPDKVNEIGSEATPAAFLDTMLALTADWRRLIPEWGSIAMEIGDTYSGSGSPGGDYNPGGMRDGQPRTTYSGARDKFGWPLAKSLCGIPTLYTWSLAYARNLLTGAESPAGAWRVRNLLTWTRPNPPVGALGDKFRPATSFVTVACTGGKRWFDLDAVRTEAIDQRERTTNGTKLTPDWHDDRPGRYETRIGQNPSGAPPLDWWDANDLDDDQLAEHWQPLHGLSTQPYKGAHYATFPEALPRRLIEAMCPREVCTVCGEPRRRITGPAEYHQSPNAHGSGRAATDVAARTWASGIAEGKNQSAHLRDGGVVRVAPTLGWTDCGHDAYRSGLVLDPFGGSGTTAVAATNAGRDCILIDLDERNVELVDQRLHTTQDVTHYEQRNNTHLWVIKTPDEPRPSGWKRKEPKKKAAK